MDLVKKKVWTFDRNDKMFISNIIKNYLPPNDGRVTCVLSFTRSCNQELNILEAARIITKKKMTIHGA